MIFAEPSGAGFALVARDSGSSWNTDDLCVVADATIDNVDALREAGVRIPASAAAAEVIGRSFLRWGVACVEHLIGDFSFILWDARSRELHAARDHLGIRPLYLRRMGQRLTLGSVAREVAGPDATPSVLGISLFIIGAPDETEVSLFEHVVAIPAATRLRWRAGDVGQHRYWHAEAIPRDPHLIGAPLQQRFVETFREAVRCRVTPGRTGVEVSGGLDSSSVAAMAATVTDEPPTALHLAYPNLDCDETRFCASVTKLHALPLVQHDATRTRVEQRNDAHPDLIFDPTLDCFEPLVEEAAARGISTVLTGVGGDQLMDEAVDECAEALGAGRLSDAFRIAGLSRRPGSAVAYRFLIQRGLRPLVPEPLRRLARRFRSHPTPAPLTAAVATQAMRHIHERMRIDWIEGPARGMVRELRSATLSFPVLQSDRLGAPHRVRFRHPFLDLRLVELMLSAPRAARLRDGTHKHKPVLRQAMRGHLPERVIGRADAGEFSQYLRYVLQQRQARATRALFKESRLADLGIIEPRSVDDLLGGTSQIQINRLTSATGMELWLRRTW